MWYKKYRRSVLWISHKARLWQTDGQTDGQMDGQNYDSQDRAGIAASLGKKRSFHASLPMEQTRHRTSINTR